MAAAAPAASQAADQTPENPFPETAVMVFGPVPAKIASLKFMDTIYEPVTQYLTQYSRVADSGGQERTGLGISGEHGSGKTFLLVWMKQKIGELMTLPSKVAYAKADSPLLSDVYRQLLRNFTQTDLLQVVVAALRQIAIQRTGIAFATQRQSAALSGTATQPTPIASATERQSLAPRETATQQTGPEPATTRQSRELAGAADLERLFQEKVLDRNEIFLELKRRIAEAGSAAIAQPVAQMVGLLSDVELGQPAFDWLCGDPPDPRLPVSKPLLPPAGDGSGDPAVVAIAALECVAALFAAARMPLILMVDQLENFAASAEPVSSWTSMIKKLVEQVRAQNGLVILAGTRAAWDRVPRDVGPRLIGRDPFQITGLDLPECGVLLSAYHPATPFFAGTTVEAIQRLSGGSPREILQIAHRCWRDANGKPESVTEADVLAAARSVGTLADRAKLARADIDRVFARIGLWGREFSLPDGAVIDRLAHVPGSVQAIAIMIAPAADRHAEVQEAQRLAQIRKELETVPGRPALLVVPIGYASESVQALIQKISSVVAFDGPDFESRLQAELGRLTAPPSSPPPVPSPLASSPSAPVASPATPPELGAALERIEALQASLEELRAAREQEAEATAIRLSTGTSKLAARESELRGARTKWDIVDGLEQIRAALDRNDTDTERAVLRSLLVANEVNMGDRSFDFLGGLYMDTLDLQGSLARAAQSYGDELRPELLKVRIQGLRAEVIRQARRAVLRTREPPWLLPLIGAAAGALFGLAIAVSVLPTFITNDAFGLHFDGKITPVAAMVAGAVAVIGAGAGWLADRWGRMPAILYPRLTARYQSILADVEGMTARTAEARGDRETSTGSESVGLPAP